jgi:hypothetical protein
MFSTINRFFSRVWNIKEYYLGFMYSTGLCWGDTNKLIFLRNFSAYLEFIDIHRAVSDIIHANGQTYVHNLHPTRSILLILRKERKGGRGCLKSSTVTLNSAIAIFRARRLSYDPARRTDRM